MRAVVTGGLGFVGRELAGRLGELGADVVVFDAAQGDDICDEEGVRAAIRPGDTVYHLAALRGSQSEQDFDLALKVNLEGSRTLLEACREAGGTRLVFASTLAVFGGQAMPSEVDEQVRPQPQTTYGTTKAVVEHLVADYRRKGFVDGRIGRLPTVIVRPDAPAHTASGFASELFRETLAGHEYDVPASLDLHLFVIGVRTAVAGLIRLGELPAESFGDDCVVHLPGVAVTVGGLVEAARRAGAGARIGVRPDPAIDAMVGSWPWSGRSGRAAALGLPQDESVDAIVAEYLNRGSRL
jgi:nucleoside-diphosphate-sugar epimerase